MPELHTSCFELIGLSQAMNRPFPFCPIPLPCLGLAHIMARDIFYFNQILLILSGFEPKRFCGPLPDSTFLVQTRSSGARSTLIPSCPYCLFLLSHKIPVQGPYPPHSWTTPNPYWAHTRTIPGPHPPPILGNARTPYLDNTHLIPEPNSPHTLAICRAIPGPNPPHAWATPTTYLGHFLRMYVHHTLTTPTPYLNHTHPISGPDKTLT